MLNIDERRALWRLNISSNAKVVAALIVDVQGLERGRCDMSLKRIGEETGLGRSAVAVALRELRSFGLTETARRGCPTWRHIDTSTWTDIRTGPGRKSGRVEAEPVRDSAHDLDGYPDGLGGDHGEGPGRKSGRHLDGNPDATRPDFRTGPGRKSGRKKRERGENRGENRGERDARADALAPVSPTPQLPEEQLSKATPSPTVGASDVVALFELWTRECDSPRSKLDGKRRKLLQRALAEHGRDMCERAILGCAASDFHMARGKHHGCKRYRDLSLIFRNVEKVEGFAELAGARAPQRNGTAIAAEPDDRWPPFVPPRAPGTDGPLDPGDPGYLNDREWISFKGAHAIGDTETCERVVMSARRKDAWDREHRHGRYDWTDEELYGAEAVRAAKDPEAAE